MSNDYRNNDSDSRWYYSEGNRYIPRHMVEQEEQRRREQERRRQHQSRQPYRQRPQGYYPPQHHRSYPEQAAGLSRSTRIARAVFVTSLSLLMLIFIAMGCVYIYLRQNILDKITFIDDAQLTVSDNLDDIVLESDEDISGSDVSAGEELTAEEASQIEQSISDGLVDEANLYRQDGVTNILLLGTDNRGYSLKGSRSDAMIILSINENTRQLVMTSVMRDTLVSIPGRTDPNKINAAHAFGGGPLAVRTVESNFGVDIDRYISINFYAFMDIVDTLGGLTLSITENERIVMNSYIEEINGRLGLHADSGKLYKTGSDLKLTGKQVLGYVRNRYTGAGDFARTERQRIVLEKIIEKCRHAGLSTLLDVIEAAAGHMTTNYSEGEIMSLTATAIDYLDYEIVTGRVPVDGTWEYARYKGMAIVSADIVPNRAELRKMIYGQ